MQKHLQHLAAAAALALLLAGCQDSQQPPKETIRLATTTSTENSGLLNVLLPAFREQTGIEVHVLPMGTGRALQTAREGNCDVVMVHAPEMEAHFVKEGWGIERRPVMYNEFLILGPAGDPARVGDETKAVAALRKIALAKAPFVSRGDNSGTHRKELSIWREAGVEPKGEWYRAIGNGMGQALTMADQMQSYVLSDSGTYLKFSGKISLVALLPAGDPALHNPYGVIVVNPERHPHVKAGAARRFVEFLTGPKGREIIATYRINGQAAFIPWARADKGPYAESGER